MPVKFRVKRLSVVGNEMNWEGEDLVHKISYYSDITPRVAFSLYEINGRLMSVDNFYPQSRRGILKIIQICLCFVALLLVGCSQPVHDERGISFVFTTFGIVFSFFLLVAYVFMLNTKLPSAPWFIMELVCYVLLVAGLLVAGLYMAIFSARHWSLINPQWETMPALAASALFASAMAYLVDLVLLLCFWKRWSWSPNIDFVSSHIENEQNNVLPH